MGTKSAWTPERRARQAEIIRRTKPWESSTGPKTEVGKAASSQNARMSDELRRLRMELVFNHQMLLEFWDRKRGQRGLGRGPRPLHSKN